MPLNNKATSSSDFVPYQQPPVSRARDLPLPKRRNKNIKWEKSTEYKSIKQKKSKTKAKPIATTTLDATAPPLSLSITSESAACNTDSCQMDSIAVDSLDEDHAMLVAALVAYDPLIALVLNANSH
ncbi:uncharacterized protein ATC70_010583 [Mucor velutinosus]|uniref:Uncharacterized protein n=1 Tax=Mucor velutinosus TaxID=708070 RepID=A0AAN7I0X5_9FUNG|nr:hypothetical protein ATC70_010583 [Mucor velutinosus]